MSIREEIGKLRHDAEIELFVIDGSMQGQGVYRFHAETNELGGPVIWQNEAYRPQKIRMSGFQSEEGQRPRPTLTISNVNGYISDIVLNYDDLVGARLIRIQTLARYLDPINFPNGENPYAGPEELPREILIVKQKTMEDFYQVEFELGAPDDAMNRQVPARQCTRNCWATYRDIDTGCDWDPGPDGPFYDRTNQPTTAENDECPHTLDGCEIRFGLGAELPYQGTPAVGLIEG